MIEASESLIRTYCAEKYTNECFKDDDDYVESTIKREPLFSSSIFNLLILRISIETKNGWYVRVPFIVDSTIKEYAMVLRKETHDLISKKILWSELEYPYIVQDDDMCFTVLCNEKCKYDIIGQIGLYKILKQLKLTE